MENDVIQRFTSLESCNQWSEKISGGRDRRILYFAGEFNPTSPPYPPPPPHIIMRNVGSRLLGNVALGQAPQWDGRGKRRKKEARGSQKTFPPLQSTAQLALLPALRKGREFRHETCPSSRASRLSRVPNPLFVPFERMPRGLVFLLFHPFFCLLLWSLVTGY